MSDRDIPGSTPPGDSGQEPSIGDELEKYLAEIEKEEAEMDDDSDLTPEELETHEAYELALKETKQRFIEALNKFGLPLDLKGDPESRDIEVQSEINRINKIWNKLTTYVYSLNEFNDRDKIELDEADKKYDEMETELTKLHKEGQILNFIGALSRNIYGIINEKEDGVDEYYYEKLAEWVMRINNRSGLNNQEKEAFMKAIESIIGVNKLDEIKLMSENITENINRRDTGEIKNLIIEMLVYEFKLDKRINHDDFDSFIRKIFTYNRQLGSDLPDEVKAYILEVEKEQIKETAGRLGLSKFEIHSMFRKIENIKDW